MEMKEHFIDAPWGKIAFLAWGNSNNKPVFLCHGIPDSAMTFEPLIQLLPKDYYYVAIDLPGNGKSDRFAPGMPLWYILSFVPAVSLTIDYLKWKKFVFIGHSVGSVVGDLYNNVRPGRIERLIQLDPLPVWIVLTIWDYDKAIRANFESFYQNYSKDFSISPKTYTRDEAVALIQKARNLTPDVAKIATERNLIPAENGKYRLCWEQRAKWPIMLGLSKEYYIALIAKNKSPRLVMEASEKLLKGHDYVSRYIESKILALNPLNRWSVVEGNHDFHLCIPTQIAPAITSFLRMNIENYMSEAVKEYLSDEMHIRMMNDEMLFKWYNKQDSVGV